MAILLMEGFEGFANAIDVRQRWNLNTTASASMFTGRDGSGRALGMSFNSVYMWMPFAVSDADLVVGFGYYINTATNSRDIVNILAEDGITEQIVLRMDAGTTLYLDRGATNFASVSYSLLPSTWYYIELEITFSDTVGTYDLYINGQNILSGTSTDTRNVSGENSAAIKLTGSSSGARVYDDMYVLDGSGADQTTRIGPCYIETVIPNADGTTVNFTPLSGSNWQNVDDGDTPDDDTTYNSSSTLNHKDLYGMAALTGNIGTIYAVQPRSLVRVEDAGPRGVKNVARSNVTEVDGAEWGVDQGYIYVDDIYENDPNGGGAWTESSVNAAEFGIKITS